MSCMDTAEIVLSDTRRRDDKGKGGKQTAGGGTNRGAAVQADALRVREVESKSAACQDLVRVQPILEAKAFEVERRTVDLVLRRQSACDVILITGMHHGHYKHVRSDPPLYCKFRLDSQAQKLE